MKLFDKTGKKPEIKSLFTSRAFKAGGYSVAAAAIVIAIAVVLNIIVGALPTTFTKLDTTSNHMYSVSEQTKKLVSALDKDVTVYWITSSGSEDSTLDILLDRYDHISDRITIVKKDPDVYPTFLQAYGVTDVTDNSLLVECGDRYRYIDSGDIFELDYYAYYYYGSTDTDFDGENELTSAIDYVTSESLPKMYILSGHGETELASTFSDAISSENIETAELSLLTEESVPEDCDILLIASPASDISSDESEKLSTYLEAGGKMLLITDPPQDGALTNLCAVMGDYGVSAVDGIVIEGGRNAYLQGYPIYILPQKNSHTITSPLIESNYYICLPISQGLTVSETLPDGVTVNPLLSTSDYAFSKIDGYSMQTYDKADGDIEGPFELAVAVEDEDSGAQIVWVSSAGLIDEQVNSLVSGGNASFFMNSINWMCERENSISILAKTTEYEYLTVPSGTAGTLALVAIGIIPLALVAAGVIITIRRKRR